MDLIELGERIKIARRAKGWSQTRLAQAAGISRTRLEALENARVAEIGFRNLLRILNALGLDLRVTDYNSGRPTLEDLIAEEEARDAARLDRPSARRPS